MNKRTIVYPGFFDPFTLGHLNIVERAVKVFDVVVVAVAQDSPKRAMFSTQERIQMIQEVFQKREDVKVDQFHGLLVDYLKKKNSNILLRGIRTVSDFEYEYQMALSNKAMNENVETFFMMTEARHSFLSSTIAKEIAGLGGDVSQMVPQQVWQWIQRKYAS